MIPQAPPPRSPSRPWIIALSVVTALSAITIVAALDRDGIVAGTALPADEYGPQGTTSYAPPSTTATTTVSTPSRFPALTPGWQTAYATSRAGLYDVPPSWEVSSVSTVMGFEHSAGMVLMGGTATFQKKACGSNGDLHALSGITGSRLGDPAAAAREVAEKWTKAAVADSEMSSWNTPITYSAAEPLIMQSGTGFHVTASITNQGTVDCNRTPTSVLHAVALPAKNGQTVVMVIYADQDYPDAPSSETMRQMYTSFRPAELPYEECKKDFEVIGTWC